MKRVVIILLLMVAVVVAVALFAPQALSSLVPGGATSPGGSVQPSPGPIVEPEPVPHSGSTGIPSAATTAVVEYVHDGDTLFLEDGRKVRLLGINTPEIGENAECWGTEATSELRGLVSPGDTVWVLEDIEPLDQYGRSLLFVFTEDGLNVNVEMVRVGAAEIEQYSPNWLYSDELHDAEEAAYAERIGLWGQC